MRALISILILILMLTVSTAFTMEGPADTTSTVVLIRCDDLGMCHTVNMAAQELFATNLPVSVSVMVACPWYQEAFDLLKRYPHVSVGVHLTLNAEWRNYRWGPVSGRSAVPSLVDSLGYFFPSRAKFFAHNPRLREVEIELRSQIERALASGVHIDYVDYHMGTAVDRPELRSLLESLAREYHVAISRYFGEEDVNGVYAAPPESKRDTLLERTAHLPRGIINLMVFHIGLRTAEMNALEDLNPFGPKYMSTHREAELRALLSPEFRNLLNAKNIRLTTYRELVQERGLQAMRRPQGTE